MNSKQIAQNWNDSMQLKVFAAVFSSKLALNHTRQSWTNVPFLPNYTKLPVRGIKVSFHHNSAPSLGAALVPSARPPLTGFLFVADDSLIHISAASRPSQPESSLTSLWEGRMSLQRSLGGVFALSLSPSDSAWRRSPRPNLCTNRGNGDRQRTNSCGELGRFISALKIQTRRLRSVTPLRLKPKLFVDDETWDVEDPVLCKINFTNCFSMKYLCLFC